jgi:mono/diheme cytochrome c family protein
VLIALGLIAVLGLGIFFVLTEARPLSASALTSHPANIENGKLLYTIGGCISCHRPADDAAGRSPGLPSGGRPLLTPIGILYPPNITPDRETGIGAWTDVDFVNALERGISPAGHHYIPAFPYTSFTHMPVEDLLDLKAYIFSLEPVKVSNPSSSLPLEPILRRGLGLWKLLALRQETWVPDPSQSESWNRGFYLVTAPGHCGECHTPRNIFLIADTSRFMAGGPHPDGKGKVPSLRNLIGRRYQSVDELVSAMRFGEAMGFDRLSSGGMGEVQSNLAKLPQSDVRSIAEYLASLK